MTKLRKGLSALLLSAFMTLGVGIGIGTKSVVEGEAASQSLELIKGTNASDAEIVIGTETKTGVKAGTSNKSGTISAKIPVNSTKLSFYAAAWKGANATLTISLSSGNISTNSFTLKADTGVTGNSPFTLSTTDMSGFLYTTDLSNITSEVTATFTTKTKVRFVLWDAFVESSGSVSSAVLQSITLNNDQSTEYYVGDTFSFTGTCTATYDDGTTKNVTPTITTAPDMTTAGTKTVNVSYTEGEVTLTASYDITVKEYAYTGDGTLENPFTVADAIFKAKQTGSTATTEQFFVKGKVKTIGTVNTQYGNSKITVTDDLGNDFVFFRCMADNGVKFTTENIKNISIVDELIACGKIINDPSYGAEFDENGCYLYDYKATGITASEPTNSGFAVGQTITVADLGTTVTADIEITGEKRDVTSEAHITSGLPLVKGDNTLTISYTQTNKYSGVTTNNSELTTTVVLKNVVQKAESVKVTASSDYVNIGETISLSAEVLPESTNDKTVVWSSLNSDIATVDENTGVVAGVKVGKATIKATCGDVFGTIEIDVKDPTNLPEYLSVEGTLQMSEYFVGETFDPTGLVVNVIYSDAETIVDVTNDVTWNLGVLNDVGDAIQVIATYTFDNNGTSDSISSTDNVTIKVVERVLDAIVVDGIKTTYTTDDKELDLNAMKVEAGYVNCNRYIDVTDKVSIEGSVDFSKLEKQTIYVVYSEGGITEKEAINITVTLANMTIKVVSGGTGVATYELVTSADQLKAGDQIVIALAEKGKMMGDMGTGKFLTATDATFDGNKITSEVSYYFTLSGGSSAWTFTDGNGKEVGATAVKTMAYDKGTTSWTIAIDSDNKATITCGSYGKILYNVNNPRFLNYNSDTNVSMLLPEIYKLTGGQTVTEYTVSEKLYTAIQEADAALVCGNSSTGTWVDGTYDVETAKGYLEMTEAADLEALKGAQADENGNMVEKFLWKYDYLVATGKIENFLNRTVVSQARVNPFITNVSNETTIAIIVIVSLVSVSVIGGYFFIRKRKEQ